MAHTISGTVVSTKMKDTIVIQIDQKMRHPMYRKVIVRRKRLVAECKDAQVAVGDKVTVVAVKPISKTKHFAFVEKVSDQS